MTSDPERVRPEDLSDVRRGMPDSLPSLRAAPSMAGMIEGPANGAPPDGLSRRRQPEALRDSPPDALRDPIYRRLRIDNRQLVIQLQRVKTELASLRRALARASGDSLTDPLTGLANRRAFDAALAAMVARACQAPPVQLLIADIDHFKDCNDTHGHDFGDAVLRIIGAMLKAAVRRDTMIARLGGDEFALLLPGATAPCRAGIETRAIAERLRARIARRPLAVRGHPERFGRVTLSIGLAGWRPGERTADWYARADAALYAAKRGGRNRVVVDAADMR